MTVDPDESYPLGHVPPETGSKAYVEFEKSFWRLWDFMAFIHFASEMADRSAQTIRNIRTVVTKEKAEWEKSESEPDRRYSEAFKQHHGFLRELTIVHAVENYLTYLKDILYLVCSERPEVLRSKQAVTLELVLKYSEMSELVDALAEQTVHELSYKSLTDLASFFDSRLGLALADDAQDIALLSTLVEVRNLLVHNRGIVNSIFLAKTAPAREQLGEKLRVNWVKGKPIQFNGDFALRFLAKSALLVDLHAVPKFNLEPHASFIAGLKLHDKKEERT